MDDIDKHYVDMAQLKMEFISDTYLPGMKEAIEDCDLERLLKHAEWAKDSLKGLLQEVVSIRDESEKEKYEKHYDRLNDQFQSLIVDAVNSCECKRKVK